jgi:hypothetical protein
MIQISKNLNLSSSELEFEKGFIFGAFEDGLIYFQRYKSAYVIEIEQKYVEWLETIKKATMVNTYGNKVKPKIYQRKNGYYRLQCYSKAIYLDLKDSRKDVNLILNASKSFQIGYLRGIFDAEGHIPVKGKSLSAFSNNFKLIQLWIKLLKELGISHGKIYCDKNKVYTLPLYGKNVQKFHDQIGLSHPVKRIRLSKLFFSPYN